MIVEGEMAASVVTITIIATTLVLVMWIMLVLLLVMVGFGSEPIQTEPKFSSRFRVMPEPNLRFSSGFSQSRDLLNLVRTSSNLNLIFYIFV